MTPPAIEAYMQDALTNPAIGQLERLAVQRHIDDLKSAHLRGFVFDEEAAARTVGFFGYLRHSKGEWSGKPLDLEPWQQFIFWVAFGWKKTSGLRRFRTVFISVARKNGKSTIGAGAGHYLFIGDGEPGAEVYTAATKKDQARIVHEEAKRMVLQSADLREIVEIKRDHLYQAESFSKYEPLGADADTLDGLNPHGILIDELHAHKTREVWDVLDTATDARRQPMLVAITTAGHNRAGIGFQVDEDACAVLRGERQDDSLFAFVARLDKGDDWRDEKNWRKANPNLGISVKIDGLRAKAAKAATMPTFQNAFLQKHMNVWTEQAIRWLPMERWDACRRAFHPDDMRGRPCWAGLDAGSTRDLSALVLVFPMGGDRFRALPFFWCSEDAANQRAQEDRRPFEAWIKMGLIEQTPGNKIDNRVIRRKLNELRDVYDIQEVDYDRWNAQELAQTLQDEDRFTCVEIPQTINHLNEPAKKLEELIVDERFEHDGNAVLRWMASNASAKTDPNGNIRPVKPEHASGQKIDGIMALINGLKRAMLAGGVDDIGVSRSLILI